MKRIRRRQAKTAPRPSFMIPSRNANTRKLHAQPLTPCHKDPCPSSSTTIMWLMATRPRTCDSPMRSSTSSSAPGPEWNRTWASRHGSVVCRIAPSLQLAGALRQHVADDPGGLEPSFVLTSRRRPTPTRPSSSPRSSRGQARQIAAQAGPALPETVSSDDLTLSPDLTRPPRNC